MEARTIELLGESDLLRARQSAARALEAWRASWGLEPREARIACVRAWEADERRPLDGWETWEGGGVEWAAASPRLARTLRESLFGSLRAGTSERDSPVSLEVRDRAIDDLVAVLLGNGARPGLRRREAGTTRGIPASCRERGSGAALLEIAIDEGSLLAVTRCARPPRQDRSGSQSFGESHVAMHGVAVTLDAQLGEVDMDIATLQSLEAGDVIRLPARLDQPLRLSAPDGKTVCFGDFGTHDGFRALSLRKSAIQEGA